jgi:hypothetical protein
MNATNKTEMNDKLVRGLLRLSHRLYWISDVLLDENEQGWILDCINEAVDASMDLYLLARQAKVK